VSPLASLGDANISLSPTFSYDNPISLLNVWRSFAAFSIGNHFVIFAIVNEILIAKYQMSAYPSGLPSNTSAPRTRYNRSAIMVAKSARNCFLKARSLPTRCSHVMRSFGDI